MLIYHTGIHSTLNRAVTFIDFSFQGLCIDLFKEIAEILDFEYEEYESRDGYFGSLSDDGQWNGAIQELIDKVEYAVIVLSLSFFVLVLIDLQFPMYDVYNYLSIANVLHEMI